MGSLYPVRGHQDKKTQDATPGADCEFSRRELVPGLPGLNSRFNHGAGIGIFYHMQNRYYFHKSLKSQLNINRNRSNCICNVI